MKIAANCSRRLFRRIRFSSDRRPQIHEGAREKTTAGQGTSGEGETCFGHNSVLPDGSRDSRNCLSSFEPISQAAYRRSAEQYTRSKRRKVSATCSLSPLPLLNSQEFSQRNQAEFLRTQLRKRRFCEFFSQRGTS